jgi:hypothetical protein
MLLLTDGTVMVQQGFSTQGWMKLTPDITGNYVNGIWTANPIAVILVFSGALLIGLKRKFKHVRL